MKTLMLSSLTLSFLAGIRLREEPYRESHIRGVEELDRAKTNFVQRIAHSLQSPLEELWLRVTDSINSLKGINNLPQRIKKTVVALEGIEKMVNRLQTASGDIMLTFSKDNVDEFLLLKKKKVNIYDFMDTLIFMNSRSYEEKGLQLITSDIPKDWTFLVDKTAFNEVMMNLLTNAKRYARKEVLIDVNKDTSSNKYVIKVIDDGRGVSSEIRERLFKAGVREVRNGNKNTKSHGFGLYLSRRVIEKHEGKIYCSKTSDKGSEFLIEIPI